MSGAAYADSGKRVSWVELYLDLDLDLDLVFVLAVAQLAHLMVAEPGTHSVWIAGIYLAGTRGFQRRARTGRSVVRILIIVATFFLGRPEPALGDRGFLLLLTGWMVACAVLAYYDGRAALSPATPRAPG